ncbi:MAG TPA: hypoxanthine phosphoribosyltransferase [Armatimonadetes bacterium]|nr:hypoxanthine phosphoribosyltransferase [Armatimonadota bacterium]
MHADIQEILITAEQIQERVAQLGAEISRDYEGKDPLLVGVLRGAAVFLADLVRHITVPVSYDFVAISSYGLDTKASGVVRIVKDLDDSIQSRHVLIVEDIVDTGLTLNYILKMIKARNPASVRVCALLDKPARRKIPVEIHYLGFTIPNKFVVGYGLDFGQHYRNLPYVGVLRPEIYAGL